MDGGADAPRSRRARTPMINVAIDHVAFRVIDLEQMMRF